VFRFLRVAIFGLNLVILFADNTRNSKVPFTGSKFSIYEILFLPRNNSFNTGKFSKFSILLILLDPNSKHSKFGKLTFSI